MKKLAFILAAALSVFPISSKAEDLIGSVDTSWALGGDHKINMERVYDPDIPVVCYISHPITGGIMGRIGLAKNHSLFSISCMKTKQEPIIWSAEKIAPTNIMSQRTSWFSNQLILTRFADPENDNVIYMVTAQGELIDGSPFSSISVVNFKN